MAGKKTDQAKTGSKEVVEKTAVKKTAAKKPIAKKPTKKKLPAKKTTARKPAKGKVTKKTTAKKPTRTRRKTPPKPKFSLPKEKTIYEVYPMRKYMEYLLYLCYSNEASAERPMSILSNSKSVSVSAAQIKKFLTKAVREQVMIYMSREIGQRFHRDQKVLMWDYLKNHGLPTSIDLDYNLIPRQVLRITVSLQQRRLIEAYRILDQGIGFITESANKSKMMAALTDEDIECYLYFFWNLDIEGSQDYPAQKLGMHMNNLANDIQYNNALDIASVEYEDKTNPTTGEAYTRSEISAKVGILPKTVYAPYLNGSEYDTQNWDILSNGIQSMPMKSYEMARISSTGEIVVEDVAAKVGIVDPDDVDLTAGLMVQFAKGVTASIALMNQGEFYEAGSIMSKVVKPTAEVMRLSGIEPPKNKIPSLAAKNKIIANKQEDFKGVDVIDPIQEHADMAKRLSLSEGRIPADDEDK